MGTLGDVFKDMHFGKYGDKVDKCPHPGCPIPKREPMPTARCDCPNMLYIPPGEHRHHTCPLHGEVVMHGQHIRMGSAGEEGLHDTMGCH